MLYDSTSYAVAGSPVSLQSCRKRSNVVSVHTALSIAGVILSMLPAGIATATFKGAQSYGEGYQCPTHLNGPRPATLVRHACFSSALGCEVAIYRSACRLSISSETCCVYGASPVGSPGYPVTFGLWVEPEVTPRPALRRFGAVWGGQGATYAEIWSQQSGANGYQFGIETSILM